MDTCNEFNDASNLNYGQMFFMTLGFLPFLLTLPCLIVARCVFEPMMADYESRIHELADLLYVPIPYEERYPVKDLSGNSVTSKNNIVMDRTPEGYVAMQYNLSLIHISEPTRPY